MTTYDIFVCSVLFPSLPDSRRYTIHNQGEFIQIRYPHFILTSPFKPDISTTPHSTIMARIFITGSSDGLGQAAAKILTEQGHNVFLHARNSSRASQAQAAVPKAKGVITGDLSTISDLKKLAADANKSGPFDAIIHNAGLGLSTNGEKTEDGLAQIFAVNSMAPYILTALMDKPKRLLYVSSGLHQGGDESLEDVTWSERQFRPSQAYNDTKLHNVLLAKAVARRWPDVQSCALDPGWVKTKLGGSSAPGSLDPPAKMVAAYAAGDSVVGSKTGAYLNPGGIGNPHDVTGRTEKQDRLLQIYESISGVPLSK
jgi:NAD(P)-dependent dehydrogenase (short-subunit alcohol dehydrogenase family)